MNPFNEKTMKQQIYNLIILDESGSMGCVTRQTLNGCNETLNTIRSAQEKYVETQEHFVSIYAFQSRGSRPSRYLFKNQPVENVKHITSDDYVPWGSTPLNDAVGSTLADLKAIARRAENAIGSVTIITDGEENSSEKYTTEKVACMIEALKEMGWNFNFIGANIDVVETAQRYCIDNALEFQQDDAGTEEMFLHERNSRMRYYDRMNEVQVCCMAAPSMCDEDRQAMLRQASDHYFDEEATAEETKDDKLNVRP